MEPLTKSDYDTLFDLIERAVNMDGYTADEKGRIIRQLAHDRGQLTNLEEFAAQVTVD